MIYIELRAFWVPLLTMCSLCIFPAIALGQNSQARINLALPLMRMELWSDAAEKLRSPLPIPNDSMVKYLLSVCHSRMADPLNSLTYAADALGSEPKLVEPYSSATKKIIEWAGITLARPKSKATYLMESGNDRGKDLSLDVAIAEEIKRMNAEFDKQKARVKYIVDLDSLIFDAKMMDPCWTESERCIEVMVQELKSGVITAAVIDYSLPAVLLPAP